MTSLRAGQLRNHGSIFGKGKKLFLSPKPRTRLWGPLILTYKEVPHDLSLRVTWPGREPDRSPPSSAEVTSECSSISASHRIRSWSAQERVTFYLHNFTVVMTLQFWDSAK